MTKVDFTLGGTLRFVAEEEGVALITIRYRDFEITARGSDMAYALPAGMQVNCQVSYVDAGGNPAAVDGNVAWRSSDDTIVAVFVDDADSTKVVVRAAGPVGQAQVVATADADLGEGTRALITTMDVEVVAGEAVAGTIEPAGAAEPAPRVEHRK